MKVCRVCQEERPFTEFYKRKAAKDGLQARCKKCWGRIADNPNNSEVIVLTGDTRKQVFAAAIFRARDYIGWSEESFNATLERVNNL
jgi:hypothetical protein